MGTSAPTVSPAEDLMARPPFRVNGNTVANALYDVQATLQCLQAFIRDIESGEVADPQDAAHMACRVARSTERRLEDLADNVAQCELSTRFWGAAAFLQGLPADRATDAKEGES